MLKLRANLASDTASTSTVLLSLLPRPAVSDGRPPWERRLQRGDALVQGAQKHKCRSFVGQVALSGTGSGPVVPWIIYQFYPPMAQQPLVGQGFLIVGPSRLHTIYTVQAIDVRSVQWTPIKRSIFYALWVSNHYLLQAHIKHNTHCVGEMKSFEC